MNMTPPTIAARLLTAVLAISLAGCAKKDKPDNAKPAPTTAPNTVESTALPPAAPKPDTIIVSVNKDKLTAAQLDEEAFARLKTIQSKNKIPDQEISNALFRIRQTVVDQFVIKTLLMDEAARRNVSVSPEEEEKAVADLQAKLPPGVKVRDLFKNAPRGEAQMKEDVHAGVLIEKLVNTVLSNDLTVTDQEIQEFTAKNKERLVLPERATASHILLKTEGDTPEAKAQKKERIEQLRKQILDGADFAELATANSDCPSKQKGGDLGTFGRNQMGKEVEDAAFSQPLNQVGPVVESKVGYHIILVKDRSKAGDVPTEEISRMLQSQKRQTKTRAFIDELRSQASIQFSDPSFNPENQPRPPSGPRPVPPKQP